MTAHPVEKIHLSARDLIKKARDVFKKVKEPVKGDQGKQKEISITDCLSSALAIFKLKFPSLLQFEDALIDEHIKQNIKNLFDLENVPCDTYMRERLDEVNPRDIRPAFTKLFSTLQRGKELEKFAFLDGKYLLLNDGTGFFSSKKIHCKNCCEKHHRKDGSVSYYHQMLAGVIAHPDLKEVIPICPEPIMKEDGAKKNDCERIASERLLRDFRREHPHLPVIIVEDALSSNGPHLKLLTELNMSFITVVKPDGNKFLFDWLEGFDWSGDLSKRVESQGEFSFVDEQGRTHKFRFVNQMPLNDTHKDLKVNFLEYREISKEGKTLYHNTWITDIEITELNAYKIARGGRARWHIENETFNTLKNQGYHFEHNFGHGYKNLSTVFAMLMMLAFLIDQTEQLCCGLFQGALEKLELKKSRLWRKIRGFFEFHVITSWEALYRAIIKGAGSYATVIDTS
jgi:hypothetical protein